jgi:GNAT superfamily N-acetyltransferase
MAGQQKYTIREFDLYDLDTVRKVIVDTIEACYPVAYWREAVDFFKDHHRVEKLAKSAKKDHIVVLEIDGGIVGTGTLEGDEITRVFVLPEYQGLGLGKAIMETLEEKARSQGIREVNIDASLVSLDFYHHLGYETTSVTYIPLEKNQRLDYEEMKKVL